ncbi:hypothetical protein SORBI_3001G068000 [Sorghum bicolor]|uniref:Uncharacterized protein n=1 Tax=Sorghum bicolor TaxID=4558 RepID=A0A1Z5S4L1_SORBI|nr:hypothetical protein SORBI_3001G068000 [Sorghum bicolor]
MQTKKAAMMQLQPSTRRTTVSSGRSLFRRHRCSSHQVSGGAQLTSFEDSGGASLAVETDQQCHLLRIHFDEC